MRASSLLQLAAAMALAQPVITPSGVVSAAGNTPTALPNSGVALGSIFLINGSNLGADNPTALNVLRNTTFPLPSSQGLNGTTVQVKTNIASGYAILLYESATQLAAITPSTIPFGAATVTVTYNGQSSAPAPVMVVQRQFNTFSINGTGYGPGLTLNYNSSTDQVYNRVSHPAMSGQFAVLIGTGLGAVRGDETQATYPANMPGLVLDLQIYVGGKQVVIDPNNNFMGRAGCCAGVDEVFFQVPRGVLGCYVPVTVVTDGLVSNSATMSISSDGGICSEPSVGLSSADLQTMINNNSARVGTMTLSRSLLTVTGPNGRQQAQNDTGAATFTNMTPSQFVAAAGSVPSAGGCVVQTLNGNAGPVPISGAPLDAGPALNVNGPIGGMQLAQASSVGLYSAMFGSSYLEAGAYEVDNGGGGNDVGAFQATLNTPPTFTWTPQPGGASIPKTVPLLITWQGGDPNSVVLILGLSTDNTNNVGAVFACAQMASVGNFTVPTYVLSWMPSNSVANSLLSVLDNVQSRFSAPGLDAGYLLYQIGQGVNVQFTSSTNAKI